MNMYNCGFRSLTPFKRETACPTIHYMKSPAWSKASLSQSGKDHMSSRTLRWGSIPACRLLGNPTYAINQRKVPKKLLNFCLFCCLLVFHWGNFFRGLSDPWCILLCISWIYLVFPNFSDRVQQKWRSPYHTTLLIEVLATLGLVGGWHNVSSCRWSGSYTHDA